MSPELLRICLPPRFDVSQILLAVPLIEAPLVGLQFVWVLASPFPCGLLATCPVLLPPGQHVGVPTLFHPWPVAILLGAGQLVLAVLDISLPVLSLCFFRVVSLSFPL